MTQVKGAQWSASELALRKRTRGRTLAARRADEEARLADFFALNEQMALTDLAKVSERLHDLHRRLDLAEGRHVTQYEIAEALGIPHRTFQSWEGGKVETDGHNYERIANYYSEKLGEAVTKNWILFGSDEEPARRNGLDGADTEQLDRIEAILNRLDERQQRLEQRQAEFFTMFEAAAATQELPDESQDHAQSAERSSRASASRGSPR